VRRFYVQGCVGCGLGRVRGELLRMLWLAEGRRSVGVGVGVLLCFCTARVDFALALLHEGRW
jgi:hypothetical protein